MKNFEHTDSARRNKAEQGAYKEELLGIAHEFLNEKGQEDIEKFLDNNEIQIAREHLLGALDDAVYKHTVHDEHAKEQYRILGFGPDEASRMRQSRAHYHRNT